MNPVTNPARKALWFIESHLSDALSLDEIARLAGVSRFHMVLPASGLKAADAPDFERYDETVDPLTGNGGFEIWIPVKE